LFGSNLWLAAFNLILFGSNLWLADCNWILFGSNLWLADFNLILFVSNAFPDSFLSRLGTFLEILFMNVARLQRM
jgi:hypothetical protein